MPAPHETPPDDSAPSETDTTSFLDTGDLISIGDLPAADRRALEAALDRLEELAAKTRAEATRRKPS